jgi:hypothetical protein
MAPPVDWVGNSTAKGGKEKKTSGGTKEVGAPEIRIRVPRNSS